MIQADRIRRTEGKRKEHHVVETEVESRPTPETTNGVHMLSPLDVPDMNDMV